MHVLMEMTLNGIQHSKAQTYSFQSSQVLFCQWFIVVILFYHSVQFCFFLHFDSGRGIGLYLHVCHEAWEKHIPTEVVHLFTKLIKKFSWIECWCERICLHKVFVKSNSKDSKACQSSLFKSNLHNMTEHDTCHVVVIQMMLLIALKEISPPEITSVILRD